MPEMKFTDTVCLSGNRSIMVSHLRGGAEELKKMNPAPEKLDVAKFGLFGGSNNYNTYYPDSKVDDFNPSEEEFIEPVFRLLSACIVSKNWMPTEFPADVLKASMGLLVGQTVNCDHETEIANAIGSVSAVEWQESYKANGVTVPAGINGILKIDAKSNPRIARGIMMDPPSIHSNSVTVQFEWKPSHEIGGEDLPDLYAFYDKLGTYDEKGQMYRRIATNIIAYRETSLVSHGADPFAQKITKNNKIQNPVYAGRVYNSFKEMPDDIRVKALSNGSFSYNSPDDYVTMVNVEKDIHKAVEEAFNKTFDTTNSNNKQSNLQEMNELEKFIESLFGENMLSLKDGEKASTEQAINSIKELVSSNVSLRESISTKDTEIANLKEKVTKLEGAAKMGNAHLKEVRDTTLASYKKLMGEKADPNIVSLIESDTTNLATLISLKNGYEAQLNEKFPMTCADCGSHNVHRGSAVAENNDDDNNKNNHVVTVSESISEIKAKKLRKSNN